MQRVRRLASVAVVATLAVTGLSACRSAPDVAVYFGSTAQISVAEVERLTGYRFFDQLPPGVAQSLKRKVDREYVAPPADSGGGRRD